MLSSQSEALKFKVKKRCRKKFADTSLFFAVPESQFSRFRAELYNTRVEFEKWAVIFAVVAFD